MKTILTVGLPASGKSTWAKQYVRDNPGTIRFNNDEFSYMTTGWDDGRSFEPMDAGYLQRARRMAIEFAVLADVDIVLDNTNLSLYAHKEVRDIIGGGTLNLIEFRVSAAECIIRNDARGNPIPNDVITRMATRYSDRYDWFFK